MHKLIKKITLLLGCTLLAACNSTVVNKGDIGREEPIDFIGKNITSLEAMNWQLLNVQQGNSKPMKVLKSGIVASRFHISLKDGRFHLRGGCNLGNGSVHTASTHEIKFSSMAMTQRGCERPLMQADSEVVKLLEGVTRYQINGSQLILSGSDKVLRFQGAPTDETRYGGKGVRKFINIQNSASGLRWREAKYNKHWIQINKNAAWLTSPMPAIQGFKPAINRQYTVRIKEYRDASTGQTVWVKDMVTMQGILPNL